MVLPHLGTKDIGSSTGSNSAYHSVHPTGGSLRVFVQVAWLEAGSVKAALSRPAHQRVTQTVRPLRSLLQCPCRYVALAPGASALALSSITTYRKQNPSDAFRVFQESAGRLLVEVVEVVRRARLEDRAP